MELDFSGFMSLFICWFFVSGLSWVQRKAVLEGDSGLAGLSGPRAAQRVGLLSRQPKSPDLVLMAGCLWRGCDLRRLTSWSCVE